MGWFNLALIGFFIFSWVIALQVWILPALRHFTYTAGICDVVQGDAMSLWKKVKIYAAVLKHSILMFLGGLYSFLFSMFHSLDSRLLTDLGLVGWDKVFSVQTASVIGVGLSVVLAVLGARDRARDVSIVPKNQGDK